MYFRAESLRCDFRFWSACLLGTLGLLSNAMFAQAGQEVVQTTAEHVATPSAPALAHVIEQSGLSFVRSASFCKENVDTEEYVLQGEGSENWSQMLTYQRVHVPQPAVVDRYVAALKLNIERMFSAARVRIVQQGRTGAIFAVHYPKTDKIPEQVSLAFVAVPDARRPNELHVIQYSVNPQRLPVEDMELQVKRWQARFQAQLAAVAK
jgi:hypothetical protein